MCHIHLKLSEGNLKVIYTFFIILLLSNPLHAYDNIYTMFWEHWSLISMATPWQYINIYILLYVYSEEFIKAV